MPDQIIYTLLENNPEFNTQGGSDTNKKKLNRSRFDKGAIRIAGHFVPTKPKGYVVDSDYIRDCYTGKPLSDTIEDVQEAAVASQEQLNNMLEDGKIKSDYLPSYVDDVVEYPTFADFPEEGEEGKIYIDLETGNSYRWSGSEYFPFSESSLRVEFSMSYPYTTVSDCSATRAEIKAAVDDGKFVYGYSERYGSLALKGYPDVNAIFSTFEHSTQSGGYLTIIQIAISNDDTYDVSFAYAPTYTYINLSRTNKLTASEFNTLVTNQTLHAGDFYETTDDGNKLYYATAYNAYIELTNPPDRFIIVKTSNTLNKTYNEIYEAISQGKQIILKESDSNFYYLCNVLNPGTAAYFFLETPLIHYQDSGDFAFYKVIRIVWYKNENSPRCSEYTISGVSKSNYSCVSLRSIDSVTLSIWINNNELVAHSFYYDTTNSKLLYATSSNNLIEITTTSYTPQP